MKQLHMRDTFITVYRKEFTIEQRNTFFLKENKDGTLKSRTVAGVNNQRDFISK